MTPASLTRLTVALALGVTALSAQATNGYFSHGYGTVARSMGGAATGVALDGFAGANNPASAVFAGNQFAIGLDLFSPIRSADRTGSDPLLLPADFSEKSKNELFPIPELGYNVALSDWFALGLTVYGNGGLNTKYSPDAIASDCNTLALFGASPGGNPLCGQGKLGVDLAQLIIAPTIAYKFHPNHGVGVSPLLVYQRFRSNGLGLFGQTLGIPLAGGLITPNFTFSQDPQSLTDNGFSDSFGFGMRVGYFGQLTKQLSVGAAYTPKIDMSKFKKYKGLFAEGGDFDVPATMSVGLGYRVLPSVLLAADYMRIEYSDVRSINNPSTNNAQTGADDGPGFGWSSIGIVKLGVQWEVNSTYTLRAGYNKGDNPISPRDVTFNILAPGVIEEHFTLGGSMRLDKTSDINVSLMYAPEVEVSGTSLFNTLPPKLGVPLAINGGSEAIRMKQSSVGVQYVRKF